MPIKFYLQEQIAGQEVAHRSASANTGGSGPCSSIRNHILILGFIKF